MINDIPFIILWRLNSVALIMAIDIICWGLTFLGDAIQWQQSESFALVGLLGIGGKTWRPFFLILQSQEIMVEYHRIFFRFVKGSF